MSARWRERVALGRAGAGGSRLGEDRVGALVLAQQQQRRALREQRPERQLLRPRARERRFVRRKHLLGPVAAHRGAEDASTARRCARRRASRHAALAAVEPGLGLVGPAAQRVDPRALDRDRRVALEQRRASKRSSQRLERRDAAASRDGQRDRAQDRAARSGSPAAGACSSADSASPWRLEPVGRPLCRIGTSSGSCSTSSRRSRSRKRWW